MRRSLLALAVGILVGLPVPGYAARENDNDDTNYPDFSYRYVWSYISWPSAANFTIPWYAPPGQTVGVYMQCQHLGQATKSAVTQDAVNFTVRGRLRYSDGTDVFSIEQIDKPLNFAASYTGSSQTPVFSTRTHDGDNDAPIQHGPGSYETLGGTLLFQVGDAIPLECLSTWAYTVVRETQ